MTISMVGFILSILLIAITIIEEIVFLYFSDFNYYKDGLTLFFGLITLSVLEVTTFLEIGIWHIEKNRVEFSLDIPKPEIENGYGVAVRQITSTARRAIYEPNKRKKFDTELENISDEPPFSEQNKSEIEVISREI